MIDYILLEKYAKDIKVLFVDDDPFIQEEVGGLLQDIFPNVHIAVNGKDALDNYLEVRTTTQNYYDLVITDIKMPIMDGISLSKEIYELNPSQKIIVLSAHDESSFLLKLVNMGIAQFIVKPIVYDDFIHVIYTIIKELYKKQQVDLLQSSPIVTITKELSWDNEINILLFNNEPFKLTKKETLLLELLLGVPEKTYTNIEILNVLWQDDDVSPDITNLKNVISRLRKKLPQLSVDNVYSFGYKVTLK